MKIHSFNVVPNLPDNLKVLNKLVNNMWFAWNWDAIMMFVSMDEDLWHESKRNPKWILGALSPEQIKALSEDANFIKSLEDVDKKFETYMNYKDTWFNTHHTASEKNMSIAYFSMEYGIGEGLPIYSGGLGMLSGDHMKTASDLGLPLVGVGLLYKKGYVKQVLNRDNWQVETYPENQWHSMPVQVVKDSSGKPLRVEVEIDSEKVKVGIWRVPVGRTSLYLLDTNLPENSPEKRVITEQLYGGDRANRISQEIVLGIGGVKALAAMGIKPTVYHVNEGHSTFLLFERIKQIMKERKVSFKEAKETVWASSVFTTHTPVMAGNEYFDFDLVKKYMESYCKDLGISFAEFLEIGKEEETSMGYCMTVVAMRLCAFVNAVSHLHKDVSKDMWHKLWPGLPRYEVPIDGITNGVHISSWISHEHQDLYKKSIPPQEAEKDSFNNLNWEKLGDMDDKELWDVHMARKKKLIKLVRGRLKNQYKRLGADHTILDEIDNILHPEYLTIGFARRFATYKRATLIMRDMKRLAEIVNSKGMPVQFIFAGKAHQADSSGKEFIKEIAQYSMDKKFNNRVIFVEDYNMNVARYMVQGVDVWMNNPIRPLEASGTSGMKAAINGVLNLSVLDGWWEEGYCPEVGWAIGGSEHYKDDEERDYVESEAIYNLIQKVIAPLYYERGPDGLPHEWMKMQKSSIKKLIPQFNTGRMVKEYYDKFYIVAHNADKKLHDKGKLPLIAAWRKKIEDNWQHVNVAVDSFKPEMEIHLGLKVPVRAIVHLGALSVDDVDVQLYIGDADGESTFKNGKTISMQYDSRDGDAYVFKRDVECLESGRHDFAIRVMPKHKDLVHPYMPLFVKWNEK